MFGGADTGFVRLSAQNKVNAPGEAEGFPTLWPTLSLKFLRDHIDSGNALANSFMQFDSYDFFQNDFHSNLLDTGLGNGIETINIFHKQRPETAFVGSLGHSEFASYDQYGLKVDNPVFPFSVRYEPNPDLSYEDTTYERTYFERLCEI